MEKLRGRSRSELPSPESEDISRRRDSRKGQQLPVTGLSSLAKTYADEEAAAAAENSKPAAPATKDVEEKVSTAIVLAPLTKDNNQQAKGGAVKEAVEKDKDAGNHSSKDKQTVNKTFLFVYKIVDLFTVQTQNGQCLQNSIHLFKILCYF